MYRFTTPNRIPMITIGDYNWEILSPDNIEVFKIPILLKCTTLIVCYLPSKSLLSIATLEYDSVATIIKLDINKINDIVVGLIAANNGRTYPIYIN